MALYSTQSALWAARILSHYFCLNDVSTQQYNESASVSKDGINDVIVHNPVTTSIKLAV